MYRNIDPTDDDFPDVPHLDPGDVSDNRNQARNQAQKIIFYNSKEFKEEEKKRQEQNEEDYWEWYNDNLDRTPWDYADLSEWEDKDE